jgi:hypothetical protein
VLKRLSLLFFLLALGCGGAGVYFLSLNRQLASELSVKRTERTKLERDLAYLKSLPETQKLTKLEASFVFLAADMAVLQGIGGTVARVSTVSTEQGQSIPALAKKMAGTEISSLPILVQVKEYRYIDELLEAIEALSRRDILVESVNFKGELSIKASLFGRSGNGKH